MHWTPLSGAQFEDAFGPSQEARRHKRSRRSRADKRTRVQPKLEALEQRQTPATGASVLSTSLAAGTSAADSNQAGDVLTSNFQLFVDGNVCGPCFAGQDVTVVEPSITDLAKTAQVSADGSTATYTLTFSNAAGASNSTAYNVRVL